MTCALMLEDADRTRPAPEVDAFLQPNNRAYVFVCDEKGEVRGWPLTSFYRTGLLFFTTYGKSVKVSHFDRAQSATVVVVTPEGKHPVEYSEISGAIRIVPFTPKVVDRFMSVGPLANDDSAETRVSDEVKHRFRDRISGGKRVLIEVDVTTAQLGVLTQGGSAA